MRSLLRPGEAKQGASVAWMERFCLVMFANIIVLYIYFSIFYINILYIVTCLNLQVLNKRSKIIKHE